MNSHGSCVYGEGQGVVRGRVVVVVVLLCGGDLFENVRGFFLNKY